jgi:hypothetical protein
MSPLEAEAPGSLGASVFLLWAFGHRMLCATTESEYCHGPVENDNGATELTRSDVNRP